MSDGIAKLTEEAETAQADHEALLNAYELSSVEIQLVLPPRDAKR